MSRYSNQLKVASYIPIFLKTECFFVFSFRVGMWCVATVKGKKVSDNDAAHSLPD